MRNLAAASTESAARVGPAIVRLQMLAAVREAWALRWPTLALGPDSGSGAGALGPLARCVWLDVVCSPQLVEDRHLESLGCGEAPKLKALDARPDIVSGLSRL